MTKTTGLLQLNKPNYNGTNWAVIMNNNLDQIDEKFSALSYKMDNKIAALTPTAFDSQVLGEENAVAYASYLIVGTVTGKNSDVVFEKILPKLDKGTFQTGANHYAQVVIYNNNNQPVYIQYQTEVNLTDTKFKLTIFGCPEETFKVYCNLLVPVTEDNSSQGESAS